MDIQAFKKVIAALTQDFWSAHQRPLLLSNLPGILDNHQISDYKEIIDGEPLKSFLKKLQAPDTFQIVVHPTQKAKIGLIPASEHYDFSQEISATEPVSPSSQPETTNGAIALLEILSKLSTEDLEKVVIPVSVLAKLYKTP